RAAGGKNFLGNASGTISGVMEDRRAQGTYHSKGAAGEWTGDISGSLRPGQRGTAPLEVLNQGHEDMPPSHYAARLLRQIMALDEVRRNYPMAMQTAIERMAVADPLIESAGDHSAYVATLLARARRLLADDPAAPEQLDGDEALRFGPYHTAQAWSGEAVRDTAISEGQSWQHLAQWQFCGPFFVADTDAMPRTPTLVSDADLRYQRARQFADRSGAEIDESPARWLPAQVEADGLVTAPDHPLASAGGINGMESFAWYASTTLNSDGASAPWVALRVQGSARVWVNDVLVWHSSGHDEADVPDRFRLPLQDGENAILVRVHSSPRSNRHWSILHYTDGYSEKPMGRISTTGFALHLASSGDPHNSRERSQGGHWPDADGPRGHRQDWHGRNPEADPPLGFNLEDGTNVAWSLPLPLGHAEPVYRDGKLYVLAEPHQLFCIDADSGEILWQGSACVVSVRASHLLSDDHPDPLGDYYAALQDGQGGDARWRDLRSAVSELGIERRLQGTATQAPVVTAEGIFVQFGTGVAARFDHDGSLRWLVSTDAPSNDYSMGHPVVLDDTVILQVHREVDQGGQYALLALDAANGEERWLTRATPRRSLLSDRFDYSNSLGNGLAVMRLITHAGDQRHLLITGDGAVIDPSDGRILLRRIFRLEGHRSGPVIDGDTVYAVSVLGQEKAQLWLDSQGRVHARTLWLNRHTTGRGNIKDNHEFGTKHVYPAPLLVEDMLFQPLTDRAHVPQHYPLPWMQVDLWQRESGRHRLRQRKVLEGGTDPTLPPRLMGGLVLVGDGGDPMPGFQGNEKHGQLAFVTADEHALPLSRVNIGKIRASPVAIGRRLYLRQYDALYALEIDGEEGRRYQDQVIAESLFAFMPLRQAPAQPKTIAPRPASSTPDGAALARLRIGQLPDSWLVCGPIPDQVPGDHLQDLGGVDTALPVAGSAISIGAHSFSFAPVADKHLERDERGSPRHLDVLGPIDYQSTSVSYFATVVDNPRVQTLRFHLRGAKQAWLNGVAIKDDEIVHLGLGHYTLIVRSDVGRVPPFARERGVSMTAHFASVWGGGLTDYAGLMRQIATHRHYFEQIIERLAGTRHAARARLYLQALENYQQQSQETP
ncbi:MAG: hypothetical protein EA402_11480, partial [Planctomycetota bacterium]